MTTSPPNPLLSVRGNIESPGAQDHYTATGRKDQRLYLDVRECPTTGTLQWTLLQPDEEPVFQDETLCSGGGTYDRMETLPQAGPYRLIVKGSDDATGTYRVKSQSR
jgi:hypothetical protein